MGWDIRPGHNHHVNDVCTPDYCPGHSSNVVKRQREAAHEALVKAIVEVTEQVQWRTRGERSGCSHDHFKPVPISAAGVGNFLAMLEHAGYMVVPSLRDLY